MLGLHPLEVAVWAVTTLLETLLLFLLFRRRAASSYPFFLAYLVSTILQSAAVAALRWQKVLNPYTAWNLAWGTQVVVSLMRSLAVVEMAKKILSPYVGIWALARRLFLWVGLGVLAYSLPFSKGKSEWMFLNGVRGLELAMAAVIVTLLVFARFYRVPVPALPRALAIGFCLYSSFYVINYSILEKTVQQYGDFWNFLGILTFMASLLVWIRAVNQYVETGAALAPGTIPPELYGQISSELNLRLHMLNKQLIQFLDSGNRRP